MSKTAIVLFNLGGPENLESVRKFLFNLFNDRAIFDLPQPLRFLAASLISTLRARKAKAIYRHMGGKSPILEMTLAQAAALEKKLTNLRKNTGEEYKTFVCMRYADPMSDTVVKKVKSYAPDRIVLLPLYPHYSTTTTQSSFLDWDAACKKNGLQAPTSRICCYPVDLGFLAAHIKLIREAYWKAAEEGKPRVLFSAHGLPEKVVRKGDPYQWQIEKTVESIVQIMAIDGLDHSVCYQSRVGPMRWIGPSTEEELVLAAKDQVPVLVVPISFVSEHSETLVELDIEYRQLAQKHGVPSYTRVPALGTEPMFIEALAELCLKTAAEGTMCNAPQEKLCSAQLSQCAKAA